ncbi:MAG: phosphate-starvation-inducible PsiE family protein [Nitrospiria bacterium]
MNRTVNRWIEIEISQLFVKGLKGVLSLLMGVILLALSAGVLKAAWDLLLFLTEDLEVALRRVIIDVLILLAVVEVFRTLLAYFTEGRVKVTFIVDTVLVVMLTEVISLWFKGGSWERFGSMALMLLALSLMRVLAVRYSPTLKTDRLGEA